MPYFKAILLAVAIASIALETAFASNVRASQDSIEASVVKDTDGSIEISEPSTILGTLIGATAAIVLRYKLTKQQQVDRRKTSCYTKCNS